MRLECWLKQSEATEFEKRIEIVSSFGLKKMVQLIEFGPASRVEKVIERASQESPARDKIRVLDIGSGGANYWIPILQRLGSVIELHLLDPVRPENLDVLQKLASVHHTAGFAPEDLASFRSDYFSVVAAFDLIEHMTKANGYRLLYEIDRICLGTSVLFTPNGHVWQPPSKNNPFNAHISGWTPSELSRLGWKDARGHTGLRFMFGAYGLPTAELKRWRRVVVLTAILVRRLPKLAFSFSVTRNHESHFDNLHNGVAIAAKFD